MKKNCTTCKYAKWQLTKTGKRMLTQPAECLFPAPELPHCYFDVMTWKMPEKKWISKHTMADCPCWIKIEKKKALSEEQAEIEARFHTGCTKAGL